MTVCPNCGNAEKFQEENNVGANFKKRAYAKEKKVYCLRCGYKFSNTTERRYA